MTLGGATTTLNTTNSPITFGSTVDATSAGAQSLALNTGSANINAGGDIGSSFALGDLTLTSGTLQLGTHGLTLQGSWTRTTGSVTSGGTVTFTGTSAGEF